MPDSPVHYYGDYVRQIFVACAVLMAIALPLWGNLLPSFPVFIEVSAIVVLVALAGLTTPRSKIIMMINAVLAGVGALLLEYAAIINYSDETFLIFTAREAVAVLLLFALYFSVKTVRAMSLKQVHTKGPSESL
jgi:hypothetical protein